MFDIAWSELALIAAVALVVIGPKDLPRVMRSLGHWVRRARMMAAEFQRNLDEMMRDSELQDIKREVENIAPAGLKTKLEEMVDAKGISDMVDAKGIEAALKDPPAPAPGEAPIDRRPPPLPPDPQPDFTATQSPPSALAQPPSATPPPGPNS